jgi:hypothetical protein
MGRNSAEATAGGPEPSAAEKEKSFARIEIAVAFTPRFMANDSSVFMATKNTSKTKRSDEAQLLALLKKVLPKAAPDPELAGKIYSAVEAELKAKAKVMAFEKFCTRVELPNLEAKTVDDVKLQLNAAFGEGDLTIKPNRGEKSLEVEVALPDGTQLNTSIPVRPVSPEESDDPEMVLKFVPFPVSLPGDPELVWFLAKRENLSADEAGIALTKAQDDFWASKTGQKLLRDRVERCFPEFISRAPAGMLSEAGLKRHYKLPEPVKVMRPEIVQKSKRAEAKC